jgi:photosystem II stability/assembly factor-like uncharacterized protein
MKKFLLILLLLLLIFSGCSKRATSPSELAQIYDFDSITMSDVNNGWAINEGKGEVYKTKDGGKSWVNVSPTNKSSILSHSYYFMDSCTAWVLYSNILYSTEDGGMHWQDNKVPFDSAILLFTRFSNSFIGWALKSYGMASGDEPVDLYKFENNSWVLVSKGQMPQEDSKNKSTIPWTGDKKGFVMLPDMLTGFITIEYRSPGDYGLYATDDGGKTWHSEKLDMLESKKDEVFVMYSLKLFNYGTKVTAILPVLCEKINGNHIDYSIIFFSKNSEGTTWHEESTLQTKERVMYIDIEDQLHWWMLTDGNLYKTEDSGKNWVELPPIEGAVEIQFINSEIGFALVKKDNETILFRTNDGTNSWKSVYLD